MVRHGAFLPLAGVGLLGARPWRRRLGVLTLGDHVARGLGQRTRPTKFAGRVIVLLLAGGAVSLAGPVGFVGLMVPHMVRYLVGMDHRRGDSRLRVVGALLMLAADWAPGWRRRRSRRPCPWAW